MEEAKHINWLGMYLAGEIGAQEKAELMSWVEEHPDNKKFFEDAIHLWSLSNQYVDEPFDTNTQFAWQKVEARLDQGAPAIGSSSASIRRLSIPPWWLRAAAVTLLLIVAGYAWYQWQSGSSIHQVIAETTTGEKKELTLPDGTQVWLNEHTHLTFDQSGGQRLVSLEGEAFFKVHRDEKHPFVISSGQAITTVLGTSFNVRAYPNEAEVKVTVASGKVRFNKKGQEKQALELTPGKSGVLEKESDTAPQELMAEANVSIWKERKLSFEDQTLRDVLPILELYFNVNFQIDNQAILNCHIQGNYDQPKLDQILQVMYHALDIKAEVQDHTVVLSGKGC